MREFKIKEELLIVILRYLDTKPYGEVKNLVNALSRLEEIKDENKPD